MDSIYSIPISTDFSKELTCPICGKKFYVHSKDTYAYKRTISKNKHNKTIYVHTWTCLCRLDERIKAKDLSFLEGDKKDGKTGTAPAKH